MNLKEKILGKREEILKAKEDEKSFIIRTINNRKHAFVSSVVNLENRDFKLIISKDIRMQDLILNILKLKKERKLESLLKK